MDRNKYSNYTPRRAPQPKVPNVKPVNQLRSQASTRRRFGWSRRAVIIVSALLVLLIGGGATYAQLGGSLTQSSTTGVNLQKGLIAWWKMDGNPNDSSPYRKNGVIANGATLTTDRKSKANSAYSFTGTYPGGSFITAPANTTATLTTTASVCGWFNMDSTANTYAALINQAGIVAIQRNVGNSALTFSFANDPSYTAAISLSSWSHFCFTKNGSTATVYINGVQVGTRSMPTALSANVNTILLGKNTSNQTFKGSLDDFRIYSRAINLNEVKALYAGYSPSTIVGSGENGLIGWWKMDGNGIDATPYRHNGTLTAITASADRKNTASAANTFNGTSSVISVPDDPALIPANVSVSVWIKPTSWALSNPTQPIISKRTTASNQGVFIFYYKNSNTINFDYGTSSAGRWDTGYLPPVGQWTHLVFTRNASGRSLYVNGSLYASTASPGVTYVANGVPLTIGKGDTAGYYYSGQMDDLRMYSRVLSANDITAQFKSYNSQISINNYSSSVNTSTGLVGYWSFNGNANDSTPYKRNNITKYGTITLTNDRNNRANSAYSFSNGAFGFASYPRFTFKSLTFSFWAKPTTVSVAQGIIGGESFIIGGPAVAINTNGTMRLDANAQTTICASSTPLVNNVWTLVSVSYEASTGSCVVYFNGSQAGTAIRSFSFPSSSIVIGAGDIDGRSPYSGSLDDVRLYNRALSAQDILKLYNDYR